MRRLLSTISNDRSKLIEETCIEMKVLVGSKILLVTIVNGFMIAVGVLERIKSQQTVHQRAIF